MTWNWHRMPVGESTWRLRLRQRRAIGALVVITAMIGMAALMVTNAVMKNSNVSSAPARPSSLTGIIRGFRGDLLTRRVSNGMTLSEVRGVFGTEGNLAGSIGSGDKVLDVYYWRLPNTNDYIVPFHDGVVSFLGVEHGSEYGPVESISLLMHELVTEDNRRRASGKP